MNDDSLRDEGSASEGKQISSDTDLTRQEFIKKIVKGAALAGGLTVGPGILDRFFVPKAYASTSSGLLCTLGSPTTSCGNKDTTSGSLTTGVSYINCGSSTTDFGSSSNSFNTDTACTAPLGDATLCCA